MAVTLQDLLNNISDYAVEEDGQVNVARKKRAANRAVEYFQRKLALPSDRKTNSFYWSDDQFFYSVPTGFMEERQLIFNDPALNVFLNEFEYKSDIELLRRTGDALNKNFWGLTTINGSNQLLIRGVNQEQGSVIEGFDVVGDWVVSSDGSSLEQDLLQKKVGDGSLSFDITYSAGTAILTSGTLSLDVKTLFEKHAYFKFWAFMTDVLVDSVSLVLYIDDSNYWTITEDDLDDGSAFVANLWKKIGWHLDDATKTGSPLITEKVTKIVIQYNLNSSLVSAADFRVDHLYTTIPDYLDFIYQSRYKGQNTNSVDLINLSSVTDTLSIGDEIPDFVDLVARRAALQLWPGLRADKDFYILLKQDIAELIKDFGLIHPRHRNPKHPSTRLKRN